MLADKCLYQALIVDLAKNVYKKLFQIICYFMVVLDLPGMQFSEFVI